MFATRTLQLALPQSPNREIVVALDAGAVVSSCAAAACKVFNLELVVDSTDPMEGTL